MVLAWPLVAFGGVYLWATGPYLVACGLLALVQAGGIRRARAEDRWLDLSLAALVTGAWLQLLPLPVPLLTAISPETLRVIETVRLVAGDITTTSVSIEPSSTLWAAGVLTANVLVFLSARALFAQTGVRWSIRMLGWLGIIFATLGLTQAASGTGAVYWWWAPLGEGPDPFGTFINRNHFATWVIMAIPACFGYAIARLYLSGADDPIPHRISRLVRVFDGRALFLLFAGILMTVALLVNLSRSGLLGFTAAAVFALLTAAGRSTTGDAAGSAAIWPRRHGTHRGDIRRHRRTRRPVQPDDRHRHRSHHDLARDTPDHP